MLARGRKGEAGGRARELTRVGFAENMILGQRLDKEWERNGLLSRKESSRQGTPIPKPCSGLLWGMKNKESLVSSSVSQGSIRNMM